MHSYGGDGGGEGISGWALPALADAKYDGIEAIRRGVNYLVQLQLPSGAPGGYRKCVQPSLWYFAHGLSQRISIERT